MIFLTRFHYYLKQTMTSCCLIYCWMWIGAFMLLLMMLIYFVGWMVNSEICFYGFALIDR